MQLRKPLPTSPSGTVVDMVRIAQTWLIESH
jgi:hypothetical protein